ncbi:hypothetical protein FRC17_008510 [Serendipita sp. 399]|nr:hypothetical protein FRC17_008510 [Serendipita sp. 399]
MNRSTGSIEKLPPEILAMIFQAYIDLDDSPWRLVCVCVKWARVALKLTALWRYIYLADQIVYPHPQSKVSSVLPSFSVPGFGRVLSIRGRRQICMTMRELEEAFLRAGMTLVDLELSLEGEPTSAPGPPIQDILCHIFSQSKLASRISRLELSQTSEEAPTFQSVSLPRLREFKWTSYGTYLEWAPFVGQLLSQCRDLHSLHLLDEAVLRLQHLDMWSNVQLLVVEENDDWPTTWGGLNTVLTRCSSLEGLRVKSSDAWPDEATPPITCPRLCTLELSHESKHLGRIRAPILISLEIDVEENVYRMPAPYSPSWETDLQWNGEADDTGLEFPLLERLAVRSEYPGWIFRLKLPNLKSLDFYLQSTAYHLTARVSNKSTEFGDIFRADWFPTVHTVKFSAVGYCPLFVAALRSVPNAEQITLIPERRYDPALSRMRAVAKEPRFPDFGSSFPRRLFARDPDFLCPKASHIQIGKKWYELEADSDLGSSLQELVEVRKKHGVPLQSLRVYLQGHESFLEYV